MHFKYSYHNSVHFFLDLKMSFFAQEKKLPICSDPERIGQFENSLKIVAIQTTQYLLTGAAGGRATKRNELINAATAFFSTLNLI